MKKIFFLSLILFIQLALSAQDKIITTNGDTILCRIISVSDKHIIYGEQTDAEQFAGKTILRKHIVEYFQTPVDEIRINNKINIKQKYPRFRVSASGGWGYRLTPQALSFFTPSGYGNYMRKLNSGFHYDAGVSCYEEFGRWFKIQ